MSMSVTLTETSCRSDGSSVVLCAYEEGACRVLDHLLGHGVLEARVPRGERFAERADLALDILTDKKELFYRKIEYSIKSQ